MTNPVTEYILDTPEEYHEVLNLVHKTIMEVCPDFKQRISWGMPTFTLEHNIIHFAAQKKHIGLYPGPRAIEHFKNELSEYKTSKGTIQIPYSSPFPTELVQRIVEFNLVHKSM